MVMMVVVYACEEELRDWNEESLILLLTQGLGAVGELFGQRASRRLYQRSTLRMLASVVIYSSLQAFVILAIAELALPTEWTGGQGSLSMWGLIVQHPGVLLNAVVNTAYWVAQAYVLREPLGVILVVLAFILAAFFIQPFSWIAGLSTAGSIRADAIILGLLGVALCLVVLSEERASSLWRRLTCGRCPTTAANVAYQTAPSTDDGDSAQSVVEGLEIEAAAASEQSQWVIKSSAVGLTIAFLVLAVTAGMGIVITTYFEDLGISNFGYAAIDQVLLPFTLLPVVAAACRWRLLARWVGEPADDEGKDDTFAELLKRTWSQTQLVTVIPFRGMMLCREFFFFYLATSFDLAPTYLQMTLLRVVMSWVASLAACTLLKGIIGVEDSESRRTVAPVNLIFKLVGTIFIVWAVDVLHTTG